MNDEVTEGLLKEEAMIREFLKKLEEIDSDYKDLREPFKYILTEEKREISPYYIGEQMVENLERRRKLITGFLEKLKSCEEKIKQAKRNYNNQQTEQRGTDMSTPIQSTNER